MIETMGRMENPTAAEKIPAPTLVLSGDAKELVELANKIADFQTRTGRNDSKMVRDFPGIGSAKTYKNMAAGNLDGYDVEGQLANYRAVWALIESMDGATESVAEPLCDDLTGVLNIKRALLETFREVGNARVIVVQGDSGTGKTRSAMLMLERYGQRMLVVEASEAWDDNPQALVCALLRAFGCRDIPDSRMERLEKAIGLLGQSRRCVVIDEAHHLGKKTLNTVKTLINRTPGEFLLLALPTLWAKLERAAYEEVRQLTTNRLAERVKLELKKADVAKVVKRWAPGLNGAGERAAAMLMECAPKYGNLAFVRDVCRRAAAGADNGAISVEDFAACVAAEIRSR